jgi:hypothetical protein
VENLQKIIAVRRHAAFGQATISALLEALEDPHLHIQVSKTLLILSNKLLELQRAL